MATSVLTLNDGTSDRTFTKASEDANSAIYRCGSKSLVEPMILQVSRDLKNPGVTIGSDRVKIQLASTGVLADAQGNLQVGTGSITISIAVPRQTSAFAHGGETMDKLLTLTRAYFVAGNFSQLIAGVIP